METEKPSPEQLSPSPKKQEAPAPPSDRGFHLTGNGDGSGPPKSDDQLIVWQKEEAPAARPELPSQLGGFAMRQAVIGLGRLTARSLRCSKREARRRLKHRASGVLEPTRQGLVEGGCLGMSPLTRCS